MNGKLVSVGNLYDLNKTHGKYRVSIKQNPGRASKGDLERIMKSALLRSDMDSKSFTAIADYKEGMVTFDVRVPFKLH